jgi:adenylate cyclase
MKKHYTVGLSLGLLSFFLIAIFSYTELSSSLESKLLDYRYNFRSDKKVDPNIAIIAIDDSSVEMLGRWPWPRKLHALLLKNLSQYPPKSIGFDILFTEPDKETLENDKALAYFSNLLGNVIYAGYVDETNNVLVRPIPELEQVSHVGMINALPDKDGIIRKIQLVLKTKDGLYPSFTLQMLCVYLKLNFKDLKIELGRQISIPDFCDIPIDDNGCMWINYEGDQHAFKEMAFQQVLSWKGDSDNIKKFAGRLVFVGITATGIGDHGNIPVATNVPLITVHANAINTILNKRFIYKISFLQGMYVLAACVILSILINILLRPIRAGAVTLIFVLLYIVTSVFLFQRNIWLDVLVPGLGFVLPFLFITVYRYGWEEKEKRWIKKAFAHYLSKDVIDLLSTQPHKLKLGGELKTATVFYADLRNFSTFCEGKSPHEVVSLLNRCFDWITEIILKNGGMLDKYIGDAIMAIFGAPAEMSVKEQAERAVSSAIEIIEKWDTVSSDMKCSVGIGIGINTGAMLIGNMGSRFIFNYTAIGDEVNVASRVQDLTKKYNAKVIITDSVYRLIKDKFHAEPLGEVQVKGRKEPVVIYCVLR